MTSDKTQLIAIAISVIALTVAIAGCVLPTDDGKDVHAYVIEKSYNYVTVTVDSNCDGSLEIWCKDHRAGTVDYQSGNHVYMIRIYSDYASNPITDLEIRY